jgi:pilus assembly protein Flp/PilA
MADPHQRTVWKAWTAQPQVWADRRPEMQFIRKIFKDKKGATAIEYGLIAALIAVAAIAAMQGLGTSLNTTFSNVSTAMKGGSA